MADQTKVSSVTPRRVAYFGIPGEPVYRYCEENDPPHGSLLNPRSDIAYFGSIGADRSDDQSSLSQLSIAILDDFLGDAGRVARLYSVFSQRIRPLVPAGRRWMVTEIDVSRAIEAAELDNKLTWDDKTGRYQDEPEHDLVAPKTYFRKSLKEEAAKSAA